MTVEGTTVAAVPQPPGVQYALPDGLGGLVASAPGGVYRLTAAGGAARLAPGALVDVSNGHVLEERCDADLRCRYWVHDLRAGTERPGPELSSQSGPGGLAGGSATISPDGAWVARLRPVGAPTGGSFGTPTELTVTGADGATVDLGVVAFDCAGIGCDGGLRWSPDGSWLFGLRSLDELFAWRPGLAAPVSLRPGELAGGYFGGVNRLVVDTRTRLQALSAAPG